MPRIDVRLKWAIPVRRYRGEYGKSELKVFIVLVILVILVVLGFSEGIRGRWEENQTVGFTPPQTCSANRDFCRMP